MSTNANFGWVSLQKNFKHRLSIECVLHIPNTLWSHNTICHMPSGWVQGPIWLAQWVQWGIVNTCYNLYPMKVWCSGGFGPQPSTRPILSVYWVDWDHNQGCELCWYAVGKYSIKGEIRD